MTTLYGIKNCDTVRKARKWLDANNIAYTFHDFRDQGITQALVEGWLKTLQPEQLVNKRSTSWKQLSDQEKAQVEAGEIIDIVLATPTLIKRPVLDTKGSVSVGFSDKLFGALLKQPA